MHDLGAAMDISTVTGDVVSSDNVEGTAVYNHAGEKLGSIDNLMIDKYSGHVQYAALEFGGFLASERIDIRFLGSC